jgi:hypothetical protein
MIFDRNLAFRNPAIVQAFEYWQARRGGRAMPARVDIDPSEMRGFLPHVCLIEAQKHAGAATDYHIRVAGTHVETVFGPITGRSLPQFLPAEIEERWRYLFDRCLSDAAPLRVTGAIAFERKSWLDAEILMAPLQAGAEDPGMLFAAFAAWRREGSAEARNSC